MSTLPTESLSVSDEKNNDCKISHQDIITRWGHPTFGPTFVGFMVVVFFNFGKNMVLAQPLIGHLVLSSIGNRCNFGVQRILKLNVGDEECKIVSNNTNFCIQFRITLKSTRSQCYRQRKSLNV